MNVKQSSETLSPGHGSHRNSERLRWSILRAQLSITKKKSINLDWRIPLCKNIRIKKLLDGEWGKAIWHHSRGFWTKFKKNLTMLKTMDMPQSQKLKKVNCTLMLCFQSVAALLLSSCLQAFSFLFHHLTQIACFLQFSYNFADCSGCKKQQQQPAPPQKKNQL